MPMKFDCPKCNKPYKLSDDFTPPSPKVIFPCRKCGHEIILTFSDLPEGQSDFKLGEAAKEEKPDKLVEKIIDHIKKIKPLPHVVLKARKLLKDEDATLSDISTIIETDPAMATRVLRFANSAYYGMQGKVASLKHAAHILGFTQIAQMFEIVGSVEILGSKLKGYGFDSLILWKHSLFTASAARQIAEAVNPALESEAFTSGLIHDVGKLVLDPFVQEKKALFNQKLSGEKVSMLNVERDLLGIDHAQAGYAVCKIWNLPKLLSNAILYHHTPDKDSTTPTLSTILSIANILSIKSGMGLDEEHQPVSNEAIDAIGLELSDMMRIASDSATFVQEAMDTLNVT